ncbi:MAG: hypothetical protein H6723_05480 [Sandaracinus sp.]|nr:hypothetical protein [Sandaracinus sp.]
MTDPSQLTLRFAAPVPRGHEVLYVRLGHGDAESGELLFDRTAGIAYCAERHRFLFLHPAVADDPLRLAREHGWFVTAEGAGRVIGAVVATQLSRHEAPVQTTLFVVATPPSSAYR